jgi:hypothetical protein
MAVLTPQQVASVWQEGICERTHLFALKNVTAGDTFDLSSYFSFAKRAAMVGVTVAGSAIATVASNVVTVPATVANDAIFLLVFGVAA